MPCSFEGGEILVIGGLMKILHSRVKNKKYKLCKLCIHSTQLGEPLEKLCMV